MSTLIPEGMANCRFLFSLTGDPEIMSTSLGVSVGTFTDPAGNTAESAAEAWDSAFGASSITTEYTFRGVEAIIGGPGGAHTVEEAVRATVGTFGTPCPSQNVAILVKKITAAAGRSGRGRMYHPPCLLGEGSVSAAGIITEVTRAGIGVRFENLLALAGWHLLHDEMSPVSEPFTITNLVVDALVATRRRRLR